MADQSRWFKLWTSAPFDPALLHLAPAVRWAWAALGCYTKLHGTRGVIVLNASNEALAVAMGVPPERLYDTIRMFPHVRVEEGAPVNGSCTVTWENWQKYQEDSTVTTRVRRWRDGNVKRNKRRREERRREERRREENKKRREEHTPSLLSPPTASPTPESTSSPTTKPFRLDPIFLQTIARSDRFKTSAKLHDPAWWEAQFRAFPDIDHIDELHKADSWLVTKGGHRSDYPAFVLNWFAKAQAETSEVKR